MIFSKLVIENFGVYGGVHTFDLNPVGGYQTEKPIVLIGGQNGTGKTTVLEAIRLCLYGKLALGNRIRQRDYDAYVLKRFHRDGVTKSDKIRIQLIFEHSHSGVRSVYDAVRVWIRDKETVQEDVSIFKNKAILHEIAKDHWNDFLRDLIPPGVADLFFFDGEKIQSLAQEKTENIALAEAVKGLLNLELVEQLNTDLITYLRQQTNKDASELAKGVEAAKLALDQTQAKILEIKEEKAHYKAQLDGANKQIEKVRQNIVSQGAGFIASHDAMKHRQQEVDQEIKEVSDEIRVLAAGLMPFALVPDWNKALLRQLQREHEFRKKTAAGETLLSITNELGSTLTSESFQREFAPKMTQSEWATLVSEIQNQLTNAADIPDVMVRHAITPDTVSNISTWSQTASRELPLRLKTLSEKLETLETERLNLAKQMKQVPTEDAAAPYLDDFQHWSQKHGVITEKIGVLDINFYDARLAETEQERQLSKAIQKLAEASDLDEKVQRAATAQVILQKYHIKISALKIAELEKIFIEYFNRLARKKDLVRAIKIDVDTFETTLIGANHAVLPKDDLSAGEKQLYAMALLWALRAISGRVFPIIVDTPMGRLDSEHRAAILDNFFPFASHQVVILSTDTEIRTADIAQLEPYISRMYRLDLESTAQATTLTEDRYFEPLTG